MPFQHALRAVTVGLTGVGLAFAFSGLSFAQSTGSVAKNAVTSSVITMNLPSQHAQSLTGSHGTITLTPLGNGQWQASWTWQKLGNFPGPIPPIFLWGWEGTHVKGIPAANLGPGPDETAATQSGDTVTIDFTPPLSYPKHPEVVQFSAVFGEMGLGPVSPVGQLPEVPWAAGLPLVGLAPLGVWAWRRRVV